MRLSTILTVVCLLYALPSLTYKGTITNKSAKEISFRLKNQIFIHSDLFDQGTIQPHQSITYNSESTNLVVPSFSTYDNSVREHNWHEAAAQAGGNWTIFDSKKPWGFDWNHSWK